MVQFYLKDCVLYMCSCTSIKLPHSWCKVEYKSTGELVDTNQGIGDSGAGNQGRGDSGAGTPRLEVV